MDKDNQINIRTELRTLEWNKLINLEINLEKNKHYLISILRKRVDQE